VLHEAEEERQIGRRYAPLIEREDEVAGRGVDQEIGVLDPLGDTFVGQEVADRVAGQEGFEFFHPDIGIDGHRLLRSRPPAIEGGARRQGKSEQSHWTGTGGVPIFRSLSGHHR
jgi:hypothetical protein